VDDCNTFIADPVTGNCRLMCGTCSGKITFKAAPKQSKATSKSSVRQSAVCCFLRVCVCTSVCLCGCVIVCVEGGLF
jgi:hypothetical protein